MKLKCDILPSTFAVKFILRRYTSALNPKMRVSRAGGGRTSDHPAGTPGGDLEEHEEAALTKDIFD